MAPDLPVEMRVPRGMLFGLKRLLVDWGSVQSSVRVDTDTNEMSVEGSPVFKAKVSDHSLQSEWLDSAWGQCSGLENDTKFLELLSTSNARLEKSKQRAGKGKGKVSAGVASF